MFLTLRLLILGGAAFASLVAAQVDTQLTGTWTTKSRKVFTGPVCTPWQSFRSSAYESWMEVKEHGATLRLLMLP